MIGMQSINPVYDLREFIKASKGKALCQEARRYECNCFRGIEYF